jgi:hypothetical protein
MKNILFGTRCYVIGAMQYEDGQDWRNKVENALQPIGIKIFNPYKKPFINEIKEDTEARKLLNVWMENEEYDKVAKRMRAVRSDDLRLCDVSDFFIVKISPTVSSFGTGEEMTTINRMKKPTFVFVEGGKKKTPLWIMGQIPHKYIYNDLDSLLDTIKKIDSEEILIDSDRWRLLRKEYR